MTVTGGAGAGAYTTVAVYQLRPDDFPERRGRAAGRTQQRIVRDTLVGLMAPRPEGLPIPLQRDTVRNYGLTAPRPAGIPIPLQQDTVKNYGLTSMDGLGITPWGTALRNAGVLVDAAGAATNSVVLAAKQQAAAVRAAAQGVAVIPRAAVAGLGGYTGLGGQERYMSYRAPQHGSGMSASSLRAHIRQNPNAYFSGRSLHMGLGVPNAAGISPSALRAIIRRHPGSYFAGRGTMAGLGEIGAAALRSIISKNPSSYFAGRMVGMGADPGMSPMALRATIAKHPGSYFAGVRAARVGMGLGQAKPTSATTDHTGADIATAFEIGTPLVTSIIGAATGQQSAAQQQAAAAQLAAQQQALVTQGTPAASTDWYWPALGAVGVLTVGGILYMMTKKPKAKSTANRRRARKNGWRRKAARSLKGKRRSRSKR